MNISPKNTSMIKRLLPNDYIPNLLHPVPALTLEELLQKIV